MPQRIIDLETVEVSIVGMGANNKTFIFRKSKDGVFEMDEILKQLAEMKIEDEAKFVDFLKSIGVKDESIELVKSAVKMALVSSGSDASNENCERIAKSFGFEVEKKQDVSPEVQSKIDSIYKEREEAIKKAADLQDQINLMNAEKIKKEFIEKAKAFPSIPMSADDLGFMMKSINEKLPDQIGKFEELIGKLNGLIQKSAAFAELGTSQSNATGGAWDKINVIAKSLCNKNKEVTMEKAISIVIQENPDLYKQYKQENQ